MARGAQGVVNSIVVQPVFAGERAVCYRERAAGMYAVLPFSLSLVRAPHLLMHTPLMGTWKRSALGRSIAGGCVACLGDRVPYITAPGHYQNAIALPRRWAWNCCTTRCRRCCTRSSCSTWSALT